MKNLSSPFTKPAFLIVETLIFVIFTGFYLNHLKFLSDPSKLYSTSMAYRLQTDAFLHGKISLSKHPFAAPVDYKWTGHTIQQTWGLGVPLLRLPFECLSQLCGFGPFPDRLVVAFYLIVMILFLNASLKLLLSKLEILPYSCIGYVLRWYLLACVLFAPGMSSAIEVEFPVYSEAVLFGCMYSYIMLSLLWVYMQRPGKRLFLVLCLTSGLAWWVRPSLIFYGLPTIVFAIAQAFQNKYSLRLIFLGIILFLIGILGNLGLNYLLYGAIFEFGYGLTVVFPYAKYYLQFDYPFAHEPFWSAAKELTGALFYNFAWQSHTYRKRHYLYMFSVFNVWHAVVLAGGFILLVFLLFRWKFYAHKIRTIYFSLIWGMACFAGLFIFYLHVPFMTDRYLSDFSVAWTAVLMGIILFCIFCLTSQGRRPLGTKTLVLFLIVTGLFFYNQNKLFFKYPFEHEATDKSDVIKRVGDFNRGTTIIVEVADSYSCHYQRYVDGLWDQFAGWDIRGDCTVASSASVIYLPDKRCLTINYSVSAPDLGLDVAIKKDSTDLTLVGSNIVRDPTVKSTIQLTQRFCSDRPHGNNISTYTIKWVRPDKLSEGGLPNVVLNWVKASE